MSQGPEAPIPDSSGPRGTSWRTGFQLLLVLLAGCLAYSNTFSVPFVFDDITSIVENPSIKDLGGFLTGEGYTYNPRRFIGYLSFALNYRFGGLDLFGYHLVNLVIHLANGLLVYALATLALNTASSERGMVNTTPSSFTSHSSPFTQSVPLFAALLFVVHPVQTQAVTYIVQRLASLATLFYLGAVVCYAYGRHWALGSGLWARGNGKTSFSPFTIHRSPFTWYFLALIFGLLAIKTKEIAVTLPLAVILYEFIFFGYSRKKLLILLAPLALGLLVGALGIVGSDRPLGQLLSDVTEMSRETTAISRLDYLVTQFSVIATYLRLLILPVGQNLDYDYPVYTSLLNLRPLWGLLLIAGLLVMALRAWRRAGTRDQGSGNRNGTTEQGSSQSPEPRAQSLRLVAFGIFWFFLTLSIESSVIPITDVIYEHRLYLPSAGFFLALGAFLEMVAVRMGRRKVMVAGGIVVLLLMAATVARNRVWGSQLSLWGDAVAKSPAKARPRSNLGKALHDAGDDGNAIAHLQMALRLDSGNPLTHFNIGVYLDSMNQFQLASNAYQRAILLQPGFTQAMGNLANDLLMLGQTDEAISILEEALRGAPDDPTLHNSLGFALLARGDTDRAKGSLEEAIRLLPGYDKAHLNLGRLHQVRGDFDLAAREFALAASLAGKGPQPGRTSP